MNRFMFLCCSVFIALSLFVATVLQSYRHYQLDRDIRELEREQQNIFATNKEVISNIIQQRSALQYDTLRNQLNYTLIAPNQIIYVERFNRNTEDGQHE